MDQEEEVAGMVELDVERPIWDRFFLVAPLVLIGTREGEGSDLAPKHMVTPMGWGPYFGFVCSPRHSTYHNAKEWDGFTVSFPQPSQVLETSLAAQARGGPGEPTPGLDLLPTVEAREVEGPLLLGAHLHLECRLDRVVDGFEENSLVVGRIVAARVREEALRSSERPDQEALVQEPLLAYVSPGRVAVVDRAEPFPFPADFRR